MAKTQEPAKKIDLSKFKIGVGNKVPVTFSMDKDVYQRAKDFRDERKLKSLSGIIEILLTTFMDDIEEEELKGDHNK